jgi:hypothetical protein
MSRFSSGRNLIIIIAIAVIVVGIGIFFLVKNNFAATPEKTVGVNKDYTVIAKTSDQRSTNGNLKLKITDAKITNSLLVQGNLATPVKGKVFLVINMEVENPYKVSLYVFPVELFRLVRDDGQKFAPSVHQGTVQIHPNSTKKSNVGFVVQPSDKKFKIEVGDIGAQKTIEIVF